MTTQSLTFDHPVNLYVPLVKDGVVGALPRGARGFVRSALPTATPINSTLGWDTVFAVPVSKVNQHFAASTYPKNFTGTFSGSLFTATATGDFGNWAIGLGGSGAIVNLTIPVASGTMTSGSHSYPLTGATLSVSVKLTYLPQPSQGNKGTPNNLQVDSTTKDPAGHAAQVNSITIPGVTDATVIAAALGCFQDFFDKNLAQVTTVFNTVSLNAVADNAAFQWLKPTYTSFAYYDAATIDRAVFGVLCMVNNNDPGTNSEELAPGAIPHQTGVVTDSGFSINGQIFMREMVLPVMSASFNAGNATKIDQSYFKITNNDTEIVQAKTIPMPSTRWGGISYYPECTSLMVTLEPTQVAIYTMIHINISAGIDAYIEQTSYFTPTLKTDTHGKQYLDLVKAEGPPPRSWTETNPGVEITEALIGIIGAVVGIVIGAWGQTAGYIIAGIIVAIVAGVVAAIPQLIALVQANGVIGNVPPIVSLVTNATNDIQWSGGQEFKIGFIQLNGSLQMGGTAFPTAKT